MPNQDLAKLAQMLKDFIHNHERSLDYVNEIESYLISNFDENHDDDAWILDALEEPLACYRPGGGYLLYDENDLSAIFKNFLEEIQSK